MSRYKQHQFPYPKELITVIITSILIGHCEAVLDVEKDIFYSGEVVFDGKMTLITELGLIPAPHYVSTKKFTQAVSPVFIEALMSSP